MLIIQTSEFWGYLKIPKI